MVIIKAASVGTTGIHKTTFNLFRGKIRTMDVFFHKIQIIQLKLYSEVVFYKKHWLLCFICENIEQI